VIDAPNVFNRKCLTHLFSTPLGEAGLRINVPLFEFFSQSMGKVLQMSRHVKARTVHDSAGLVSENNVAVLSLLASETPFVDKPMMMPA
jgi:hypothetical protein